MTTVIYRCLQDNLTPSVVQWLSKAHKARLRVQLHIQDTEYWDRELWLKAPFLPHGTEKHKYQLVTLHKLTSLPAHTVQCAIPGNTIFITTQNLDIAADIIYTQLDTGKWTHS